VFLLVLDIDHWLAELHMAANNIAPDAQWGLACS